MVIVDTKGISIPISPVFPTKVKDSWKSSDIRIRPENFGYPIQIRQPYFYNIRYRHICNSLLWAQLPLMIFIMEQEQHWLVEQQWLLDLVKLNLKNLLKKIIDFAIPPKESTPLKAYKQWREWADPKV